MTKVGKFVLALAALGMLTVVGVTQGATLSNQICATFGIADGGRPAHCNGKACANNPSVVYCWDTPTWSIDIIAYEYNSCVFHENSQCQESGQVTCAKFQRHETLNCGDWFTCNSYTYVTGC